MPGSYKIKNENNNTLTIERRFGSDNPNRSTPLELVQSLNSPFFPPHIGLNPGGRKEELFFSTARVGKKGEFRDCTTLE